MTATVQLLGLSNAIVDILAHVEDDFLQRIGAPRGSMILIDEKQAQELYEQMGPAMEMSGGSVGNSVAGFANLGGTAAYIGRVAADQFGNIFAHDMKSLGVAMRLPPETRKAPTARSHVLISPDGQRTMQTYLGACTEIEPSDITTQTIGKPDLLLIEGYIWDTPHGPEVTSKAIELAHRAGGRVALSLSDDQCVARHHAAFTSAIAQSEIVFANETEIMSLFKTSDFDEAVTAAGQTDVLFAITRSEKGSVIVRGNEIHHVKAEPIEKIVDSTGAGDAYSAGFLFGLAQQKPLPECGRLGSQCAAAVIQQLGARFEKPPVS